MRKRNVNFEKLIEIFNNNGKEAAVTFVEDTYGTTYEVIQRRIKKETNYFYNRNTKKYEFETKTEPTFMTIEELYEGDSKAVIPVDNHVSKTTEVEPISDDFDGTGGQVPCPTEGNEQDQGDDSTGLTLSLLIGKGVGSVTHFRHDI